VPDNLLKALAALIMLLTLPTGVTHADEALRDPTRPYSLVKGIRASSPDFVVNAIIISPQRRVAIVNGRRVAVGGSLGAATVTAIEKDHLVLDARGKRIKAYLNQRARRR